MQFLDGPQLQTSMLPYPVPSSLWTRISRPFPFLFAITLSLLSQSCQAFIGISIAHVIPALWNKIEEKSLN